MNARLWTELERLSKTAELLRQRLQWASGNGDQLAVGVIHSEIASTAKDRRDILARLSQEAAGPEIQAHRSR